MHINNIYIVLDESKMIVFDVFLNEIIEYQTVENLFNNLDKGVIYITTKKRIPFNLSILNNGIYTFNKKNLFKFIKVLILYL